MAQKLDLTVVLFSCGSATEQQKVTQTPAAEGPAKAAKPKSTTVSVLNEPQRQKIVKNVLGKIEKEYPGSFVLVQNDITDKIHVCMAGSAEDKPLLNKHAGVYYLGSGSPYNMEYVYVEREPKYKSTEPDSKTFTFPIFRMRLCIATHKESGAKILVVSWQGPEKVTDDEKVDHFCALIDLLLQEQEKKRCGSVVVGGYFGLEAKTAEDSLKKLPGRWAELKKPDSWEIFSGYEVPEYKEGKKECGYFVCWPNSMYKQKDTPSVIEPDRVNGKRPFRHPVVVYQLKMAPKVEAPEQEQTSGEQTETSETQKSPKLERAEQEQVTGEQAQTSEIQRYRDEIEKLKKVVDERNKTIDTLTKKHDMLKKIIQETDEIFAQHFEQLDIQSGTASKPQ